MKKASILLRRAGAILLALSTLWAFSVVMHSDSAQSALQSLSQEGESSAVKLLRWELGDLEVGEGLSLSTLLALSQSPLLFAARGEVLASWEEAPAQEIDPEEGTVLEDPDQSQSPPAFADNGVPAKTLQPSSPEGYVLSGDVYINNSSDCALSPADLEGGFAAKLSDTGPQVLIVHTHGSEAYTMPAGQEYAESGDHRCIDSSYNMIRIGDEIANCLSQAGISVLHDRELYDYPNYSGAYSRSQAAIERQLEKYPSIAFVLDVHRDAVSDSEGNPYKVLSQTGAGSAAQLEFVMGSSGGGSEHPQWRENLKLAAAIQQTLTEDYPTLMRPIILRNARYNQHLTTGSLLLEVGAAGNSLEEALLSARLFADAFAQVILK